MKTPFCTIIIYDGGETPSRLIAVKNPVKHSC